MEPFGAFFGTKCTPYLEAHPKARSGVKGLNLGNINIIMTQYYSILKVNYRVSIPKYSTTYNVTPTPVPLTCISLPFLFPKVAKVKIPQKFQLSSFCQMLKSNDIVENKCTAKEGYSVLINGHPARFPSQIQ